MLPHPTMNEKQLVREIFELIAANERGYVEGLPEVAVRLEQILRKHSQEHTATLKEKIEKLESFASEDYRFTKNPMEDTTVYLLKKDDILSLINDNETIV
jgi:hypothetical protein